MGTLNTATNAAPLWALELFCGIGGFAAALERAHVQEMGLGQISKIQILRRRGVRLKEGDVRGNDATKRH